MRGRTQTNLTVTLWIDQLAEMVRICEEKLLIAEVLVLAERVVRAGIMTEEEVIAMMKERAEAVMKGTGNG